MMVVVDAQFIEPYTVDLAVQKKSGVANLSGNFTIIDVKGNMMFKIKDTLFSFHDRHILYDANDKPVLTFKKKLRSIHGRWQAFKGESTTNKDLLFSVKKSSAPKHETELDVFLVENKEETECDCKVIGDWDTKSCTIYAQDGSTALAEVHDKQNITNVAQGKDTFGITVYPEVDYVFIVALVVILTEIKSYDGIGKNKKRKKKKEKKSSDSSDEDNKKENAKIDEERNKPEVIKELEVESSEEDEEEEEYEEEDEEEEEENEEEKEEDEYEDEDEEHDMSNEDDNNESYEGEPKFDEYYDDDGNDSSSSEDESPKEK
ncbi:putative tubby-like protein [Helianthus debilis subsp. tardiflorus]